MYGAAHLLEPAHSARYFRRLAHVLPCRTCRDDYDAILHRHPPEVSASRQDALLWVWRVETLVSESRNVAPPSFPDVMAREGVTLTSQS